MEDETVQRAAAQLMAERRFTGPSWGGCRGTCWGRQLTRTLVQRHLVRVGVARDAQLS